jgi:hypothetical protein
VNGIYGLSASRHPAAAALYTVKENHPLLVVHEFVAVALYRLGEDTADSPLLRARLPSHIYPQQRHTDNVWVLSCYFN